MKALRLGELPEVAPETLGVGQLCAETARAGLGGGSICRQVEREAKSSSRSLVDDRLPLAWAKAPPAASARVAPMARVLPSDFIVIPPVELRSVARADDAAQELVLRW